MQFVTGLVSQTFSLHSPAVAMTIIVDFPQKSPV